MFQSTFHTLLFQQVMRYLGVDVRTHMPRGSDGRRVTARAKGKVERPFRTVKEMHEMLYPYGQNIRTRLPTGSYASTIAALRLVFLSLLTHTHRQYRRKAAGER